MNTRQKKFADNYVASGNAEQSAIDAGYSERYARGNAYKMVAKSGIKEYIEKQMEKLEKKKIAKADEVLIYLTSLLRGEELEEEIVVEGTGEGTSKASTMKKEVSHKDRIRAGELIGRRYGLWKDDLDKGLQEAKIDKTRADIDKIKDEDIDKPIAIRLITKGDADGTN